MRALEVQMRRLEAHLQEEIAAQDRALELLAGQEEALLSRDPSRVLDRAAALERELRGGATRAQRREEILAALGALWQVPPAALTLSSVAERAGAEGKRVLRMRSELRARCAEVVKLARRIGALARTHQRCFADLLQALFSALGAGDGRSGGRLVDAEA